MLLVAGFHGDEPSGVVLLERFGDDVEAHPEWTLDRMGVVVPVVNPDGLANGTRASARGVDLNRNFPTRRWKASVGGPRQAFASGFPSRLRCSSRIDSAGAPPAERELL